MSEDIGAVVFRKLKALIKMKTAKEFDPDMVGVFMEALEEYSPEDILRAIKMCSKTKTYGIQPSDLIEHLEPSEAEFEAAMDNEIAMAVSYCKKNFRQGKWSGLFEPSDGAVYHAFNVVMEKDWEDESSMKFFYRDFEAAYKNYAKMPSYRQELIALEAEQKKKRLASYENGGLLSE